VPGLIAGFFGGRIEGWLPLVLRQQHAHLLSAQPGQAGATTRGRADQRERQVPDDRPALVLPNVRAVSRPAAMKADTVNKMTSVGTVSDGPASA
jgi:hypothetical protein